MRAILLPTAHCLLPLLTLLLLSALAYPVVAAPTVLYVAPDGKDTWSGQSLTANGKGDGPLATLTGARDRLRQLRKQGALKEGATVFARPGIYLLRAPLTLTAEDSGTARFPIVYTAWPGETVTIGGGRRVTDWKPAENGRWTAALPAGDGKPWRFRQLFVNGWPQPRARHPNTDNWHEWPLTIKGFPHDDRHDPAKKVLVHYPEGALFKNWRNLSDIEVNILASWRWINAVCPLKSVDETNRVATLAEVAAYHINKNDPFRVENAPEAIDEPGEWCLNTLDRAVTLLPPKGVDMRKADVIAPALDTLIRIEGKDEGAGRVRYVTLRGFTFSHSGDGVAMSNVENCVVEGCRFLGLGRDGIIAKNYVQRCRFLHNEMAECGGSGIALKGYPPGTKYVTRNNEISGNHIHHCGRTQWQAPGILLIQAGENVIRNNYVHHVPYSGIQGVDTSYVYYNMYQKERSKERFGFRWEEIGDMPLTRESVKRFNHTQYNLIEANVVHNFMQLLEDGGGIYLGFLGVGNVVRNNVVYGTNEGLKIGIYLDDEADHILVEDNIVYDVARVTINYRPNNVWLRNHFYPRDKQPPLAEQAARSARLLAAGLTGIPAENALFDTATGLPSGVSRELPTAPPPKFAAGMKPEPGGAFLSDLSEILVTGHNGVFKDTKYGGAGYLRLGDNLYAKGIVLHPLGSSDSVTPNPHDAQIVYDLGGKKYKRLRALVGIEPPDEGGQASAGSVTFEVYTRDTPIGEWKRVYDSGVVTATSQPFPIEVNIAGARQLRLRCTDAGDDHFSDVAVWASACVD